MVNPKLEHVKRQHFCLCLMSSCITSLACGLLKSETAGACDVLSKDLSETCGMHVKRGIKLVMKLLVQMARICAF